MNRILTSISCDSSGQMSVELAVMMPVVLAVALIVVNLARFIVSCAVFDRVAFDAVVAHASSSSGASLEATSSIQATIERALGSSSQVEVSVSCQELDETQQGLFSLAPALVKYTLEMRFYPIPQLLSLAGVRISTPFALIHTRTICVDAFRSGVVV